MATNYETRFYKQVAHKPCSIQRFAFPGELVFLVSKSWVSEPEKQYEQKQQWLGLKIARTMRAICAVFSLY